MAAVLAITWGSCYQHSLIVSFGDPGTADIFNKPMGLTQRDLAQGIYVPYQRVNELVNRRRGLTSSTALRLAKYFGTSPDFWMNLQLRWDLYHTQQAEAHELKRIKKVKFVR